MARRTKEEALATRNRLLDGAEMLFQAKGVSRTSLHDIAQAAGTTRGAIYWHFKDKADLFNAMMERVTLPMENALLGDEDGDGSTDSLTHMRMALLNALARIAGDAQTRRVFEVVTHKVEYVEELSAVRERHLSVRGECLARIQQDLRRAATARGVRLRHPALAARGLHALIDGLIQNWLLDPGAFDLVTTGKQSMDLYLSGLGLSDRPGGGDRR
ncbi:MAG: TetR family transcriptional regulator [Ramlibacter sp.]|nr:TetR family transcriptional regulator [Ramlibacter sp.]